MQGKRGGGLLAVRPILLFGIVCALRSGAAIQTSFPLLWKRAVIPHSGNVLQGAPRLQRASDPAGEWHALVCPFAIASMPVGVDSAGPEV